MVDWDVACLLAANCGSKVRCADNERRKLRRGATVSADQLPLPRLYSATGRARRRKWRCIKYTPLPLPLMTLFGNEI